MSEFEFDMTKAPSWHRLMSAAGNDIPLSSLLREHEDRVEKYSTSAAGLYLDFSKNLITDPIWNDLLRLLDESPFVAHRDAMFSGNAINNSENRAVLHSALRASPEELNAAGLGNYATAIQEQNTIIESLSDKVRNGSWTGSTGKRITDVVNIGIGGSDLGPKLVCDALKQFAHSALTLHFIANVDGEPIHSMLRKLDPETTLFLVSSKTFTTQETLRNADTAAQWLAKTLHIENPYNSTHIIAVTASAANARTKGVPNKNIVLFWDWVGGRYSLWSSIGLSIAIAIGYEGFQQLRDGARQMDEHFRSAPPEKNMPVILALLGIWNATFLGAETHAVIPYCERLFQLPMYLQQLDMESNGKSVSREGQPVATTTGPIIWGLTGTNGQHSFFQLIHQGTHLIPVDFIGVCKDGLSDDAHHRLLMANMVAQSAALAIGRQDASLPACRQFQGNKPSNTLLLDELSPATLGALIALYEHKVFVQGSLWGINSFDQWGVELGKALANMLLDPDEDRAELDYSTQDLIRRLQAF